MGRRAREGQHRGRSEPLPTDRGHLGIPGLSSELGTVILPEQVEVEPRAGSGWGRRISTTLSRQGIGAPCRFPGWQPAPALLSPKSGESYKAAGVKSNPESVFWEIRVAAEPRSPVASTYCFLRHAAKGRMTRERDRDSSHPIPGFPRHFLLAWNGHPLAP